MIVSPGMAISVILRTLGGRHLPAALDSLACQTWRDFEVVVVDMSGGRIGETLAAMEPRLPKLVHLTPSRRLSRPAALNAGIAAAGAPSIAILDEDNLYDPGHLEQLAAGLETTGADYVYTGVRHATYDDEGRRLACRDMAIPFRLDWVIFSNFIYATGSAYRKSLWERVGGFDERFTVFEDWDFILRVT